MTCEQEIDWLHRLPSVFESADAEALGVSGPVLADWVAKGLIQPAGPAIQVYYNLREYPDAERSAWHQAVRRVYPSAVVVGAEILHRAGIISQVPARITVACRLSAPSTLLTGVEVSARSKRWYEVMADQFTKLSGLPALTPGQALADLLALPAESDQWVPAVDDIDWCEFDEVGAYDGFLAALTVLRVPNERAAPYLAAAQHVHSSPAAE